MLNSIKKMLAFLVSFSLIFALLSGIDGQGMHVVHAEPANETAAEAGSATEGEETASTEETVVESGSESSEEGVTNGDVTDMTTGAISGESTSAGNSAEESAAEESTTEGSTAEENDGYGFSEESTEIRNAAEESAEENPSEESTEENSSEESAEDPGEEENSEENSEEAAAFGMMLLQSSDPRVTDVYVKESMDFYTTGSSLADAFTVCGVAYSDGTGGYLPLTISSPGWPDTNYTNNLTEDANSWEYSCPGADYITVTFDPDSATESSFDYVRIYDKDGNRVQNLSGSSFAGQSYVISGDSVRVTFMSDGSTVKKGFSAVLSGPGTVTELPEITSVTPEQVPDTEGNFQVDLAFSGTDFVKTLDLTAVDCIGRWEIGKNTPSDVVATLKKDGTLVITGSGEMDKFTIPSEQASLVKTLSVADGITNIGSGLLNGCTNLTEASLPESVTSIDSYAFNGCTSLSKVNIPENVKTIDVCAFYNCQSLPELTLPEGIETLGQNAFMLCNALTEVTFPSSLASIGYGCFASCENLEKIVFLNPDTSLNQYAFYDCKKLADVTLPANVKSIPYAAFKNCSALASIDIPDSVTSIGGQSFYGTSLTEIDLPSGLTWIGPSAFAYTKLQSVDIPDDVETIGAEAFEGCTSLSSVKLPSELEAVSIEMFNGCSSLSSIELPDTVKSIGRYAFYQCTALKSIVIPDSVGTVSEYAFGYCSGLKEVTIGSSAELTEYCFYACNGVTKAVIRNSTLCENEFSRTSLKELVLESDLTDVDETSLVVSGADSLTVTVTDQVNEIPSAFFDALKNRSNVNLVFQGENELEIEGISEAGLGEPYSMLEDGKYLVDASGNLYLLDEESENAELVVANVMGSSFTVPASVLGHPVTGVGTCAFRANSEVSEVLFEAPEQITSIAVHAFLNMTELSSINGLNDTDEINALFADNASIGMEAYRNTKLGVENDYEETRDALILRDSDGKGPTVYVATSTASSLDTETDKFNLYTGEVVQVSVSISNNDNTVTGEKIRIYLQFDADDCEISYEAKNWTLKGQGDRSYDLSITRDKNNRYCLEFDQPDFGDTINFEFTADYPSPKSDGGEALIWGDVLKADEVENHVTSPVKVQRASWTTKADDWTLSKSPYNTKSTRLYSDESLGDYAFLRSLSYQYNLIRSDETLEGVGKDYMERVIFTDVLTLPAGYSLNPDLVQEINAGNVYMTSGLMTSDDDADMYEGIYCKVNGKVCYIASLYYYYYVNNSCIDVKDFDVRVLSDDQIEVVWEIDNPDLATEIPNVGGYYYRIKYGRWLIRCDMNQVPESTVSDFQNDLEADQQFMHSDDQFDAVTAVQSFDSGTASISVYKSGMSHVRSGQATYTLQVKNGGSYPYTDLGRVIDALPTDFFIRPEDMETMFADDTFGSDALTITITNATLCDVLEGETVTMSDGTEAVLNEQQLRGKNAENEDAVEDFYGSTSAKDENQLTNNATVTLTKGEDGAVTVSVASGTGADGTYTVGVNGTLPEIFDAIGFLTTSSTQYKVTWDHDNADGHLKVRGGQTLTYEVPAMVKSSFMAINEDTNVRESTINKSVYNYVYAYSAKEPSNRIGYNDAYGYVNYEFSIDSTLMIDGEDVEEGANVDDNTVLDNTVGVTHVTTDTQLDYSVTPIVKELTGAQVLMAETADNPDLALLGLPVLEKDGVSYFLLNRAGKYDNVSIGGTKADTVIVEDSASGKNTVIKWYENMNGVNRVVKSFRTYLSREESGIGESAFYGFGGMSWLGDHEAHRLYVPDPGHEGSVVTFDKNIVTNADESNGPDEDELAEYSVVHEGETVTYRLDLSFKEADGGQEDEEEEKDQAKATIYGSDIQDELPVSIKNARWDDTSVSVRYQDDENVSVVNGDNWNVSYTDRNGADHASSGQQYIRWADDFAITFSGTAHIYVTLTFPESDLWQAYAEQYGSQVLNNTFYLHDMNETVTHELGLVTEAYLNKGVTDAGWIVKSHYYSSQDTLSRKTHVADDSRDRVIQYYGTVYDSGNTRLYLDTIYDVLPEGYSYKGLTVVYGNAAPYYAPSEYTYCYLNQNTATETNTYYLDNAVKITDDDRSSIKYRLVTITSKVIGTTQDGCQVVSFDLSSVGAYSSNSIHYDEERKKYYLNPGEAFVFGYFVDPGTEDTGLPAVRTNSLMMQLCDYTLTGVSVADLGEDGGIVSKRNTEKIGNDGTCEMRNGIEVSAETGLTFADDSDWLHSDVSMTSGEIMPGITVNPVSATTVNGTQKTNFNSVEPSDSITWQLVSENSGDKPIRNYTVTDVMQSPYEYEGDVKLTIRDNSGSTSANSTLFTIGKRGVDDEAATITYLDIYGKTQTMTLSLDGTQAEIPVRIKVNGDVTTVVCKVVVAMKKDSDGNSTLAVTFPDSSMAIPEGGSMTLEVTTTNPSGELANKVYTNKAYMTPLEQSFDHDSVDRGNYAEYEEKSSVKNSSILTVAYGYVSSAVKSVEEIGDDTNSASSTDEKNYITLSEATSLFRYTLQVDNTTLKPMSRLIVIDNLPEVGDIGTFAGSDARESGFEVDFADDPAFRVTVWNEDRSTSTVLAADQYTLEFSDNSRDFTQADWDGTSTWNGEKTSDSRSFRVMILDDSGTLIPEDSHVEISFDAEIDMGPYSGEHTLEDDAGKIAWNSFGYHYRRLGDTYDLEAAPEKVGVQFRCYPHLQKKVEDFYGDHAASEDLTFTFVLHGGAALEDYSDSDAVSTAVKTSGNIMTVIGLTVPEGDSVSEDLLLKPSSLKTMTWDADAKAWVADGGTWTWTDGGQYTIAEIGLTHEYASGTFGGQSGNAVTFTYTKSNRTLYKCINMVREGSVAMKKLDSDGKTALSGVTFEITGPDGFETQTRTTGEDGILEFSHLPAGTYEISEVQTADDHTLLQEPVEVTIPLEMTQDEIDAKQAAGETVDLSRAVREPDGKIWYFYDMSFEVTNSGKLRIPMTGAGVGTPYAGLALGLLLLGGGAALIDSQRRRRKRMKQSKNTDDA